MKMYILSEMSIDGKIAFGSNGSSRYFINNLSREEFEYIHNRRTNAQAIIVGKNTVDVDNPSLTDRVGGNANLLRVIPSNSLAFDFNSTIFNDEYPTLIVTCEKNKDNEKVKLIRRYNKECIFIGKEEVDFKKLRKYLEIEKNVSEVIVEGGGILNYKMLCAGIIDEIIILLFPFIIGGGSTPTLVDGIAFDDTELPKYNLIDTRRFSSYFVMKFKKVKEK